MQLLSYSYRFLFVVLVWAIFTGRLVSGSGEKLTTINLAGCDLRVVSLYQVYSQRATSPWQIKHRLFNAGTQDCLIQSKMMHLSTPVAIKAGEVFGREAQKVCLSWLTPRYSSEPPVPLSLRQLFGSTLSIRAANPNIQPETRLLCTKDSGDASEVNCCNSVVEGDVFSWAFLQVSFPTATVHYAQNPRDSSATRYSDVLNSMSPATSLGTGRRYTTTTQPILKGLTASHLHTRRPIPAHMLAIRAVLIPARSTAEVSRAIREASNKTGTQTKGIASQRSISVIEILRQLTLRGCANVA